MVTDNRHGVGRTRYSLFPGNGQRAAAYEQKTSPGDGQW